MKESYVKAVGVGLSMDLRKIDFHINSDLSMDCSACDTKLYVNGELQSDWRFEETMLDSTHTVVTALSPFVSIMALLSRILYSSMNQIV